LLCFQNQLFHFTPVPEPPLLPALLLLLLSFVPAAKPTAEEQEEEEEERVPLVSELVRPRLPLRLLREPPIPEELRLFLLAWEYVSELVRPRLFFLLFPFLCLVLEEGWDSPRGSASRKAEELSELVAAGEVGAGGDTGGEDSSAAARARLAGSVG